MRYKCKEYAKPHAVLHILYGKRMLFSVKFLVGLITGKLANLVLEHCKLLEQVVYRFVAILVHWGFAVERHELLYTIFACTLRKVTEK